MGIIIALIVGGLAGLVANLLINKTSEGVVKNIVVGIIGSFVGNVFVAPLFNKSADLKTFDLGSFLVAVAGAVILLILINLFTRSKATQ